MKKTFLFSILTAAFLLFSTVGCKKEVMDAAPAPGAGGGKPNLTITTVNGPTNDPCGGFKWQVIFTLNNPSPKGGWIIQEIEYDQVVIKCPNAPFINKKVHYWEAWRVAAGTKGDSERLAGKYTYDDQFSSPNFPDTRGHTTITGKVKFYEGLELPASFKKNNDATYAGGLPATTDKPDFWTTDNTANHNFSIVWNCCNGNTDWVLTHTPDDVVNDHALPGDIATLDPSGRLIAALPTWTFNSYPITSAQLVNVAKQLQMTTTPATLHNSLVNYEKTFAHASDYIEQMSKVYLVLRVMYQLPQEINSSNAKVFGGWIHPSVGNNSGFNMSWPVSATLSLSGWQVSIQGYLGYMTRAYDAAAELDYFNSNFPKRNL